MRKQPQAKPIEYSIRHIGRHPSPESLLQLDRSPLNLVEAKPRWSLPPCRLRKVMSCNTNQWSQLRPFLFNVTGGQIDSPGGLRSARGSTRP